MKTIEVNQRVETRHLPHNLCRIRVEKKIVKERISTFLKARRNTTDTNNIRRFCIYDENFEFSCARVDAVFRKKVNQVLNPFQRRGQNGLSYLTKSIPSNDINETLGMTGPVPKDIYRSLKAFEDRLIYLESVSPGSLQFFGDCHEGFCVRSIKQKVPVTNIPPTENFNLSTALESVYPLLEIVFNYLNYNDLKTCCAVKRSWRETAQRVLNKRVRPSWFTCYRTKTKPKSHYFDHHSANLNYNNVGLGIILYDFRRIKLNKYICVHTDVTEISRKSVPEYLEDELIPKNVNYCVISCPKVVSFFSNKSLELRDVGLASILDGLFFPQIPDIRITSFHCNPIRDKVEEVLRIYMNPNEEVKCLLLFSTTDQKRALYNFLKYIVPQNNATSVALGGGIIRGTKTFQRNIPSKRIYSSSDIFSIAFLKNKNTHPNFDAFSYVIYGDDLSRDEFAEEILKFKEKITLRTHTAAIRICCSAKVDADEEPIIFSKIFPDVPVLGFHADGEIGWNCVLSQDEADLEGIQPKKAKHKYPKAQHQWSTVFVVITWGKEQT